jgi:hypothetical protein
MSARLRGLLAGAALLAGLVAGTTLARADGPLRERVELSAPLLPRSAGSLGALEGPAYPTSLDALVTAVDQGVLTFAGLLEQCRAWYPGITPPADGTRLTAAQTTANYDAVAQCAYEHFESKPYWIPQLLVDVDVCAQKLGAGWHLPDEADVASLTDADLQFLHDTLAAARPAGDFGWGAAYFDTAIYVRGAGGSLRQASLAPGANPRVADIVPGTWMGPGADWMRYHNEAGVGVRCWRRTALPAK